MRRRWNKIMALLLASAVLTANVGMVSAFAAGDEKTEQDAQKEESEEKTGSDEKKADKEDKEKASQTSAPTVDVKEGTYSTAQKITLKCATKDAVIYYTTDGKEPTEKSTRFDSSKPVEVKTTTTIKAIAVAKDTGKSKVASFTYKIEESAAKAETETPAETPTATPTADPTMIPEQAQTQSEQGEAQLMPASSEQQEEEKAGETPTPTPTETATPTPTETPGAVSAISSGSVVQEIAEGASLADLSKTETMQVIAGGEEFEIISAEWKSASASEIDAAAKYQVTLGLKAKEGFCFDSKTTVTFNGVTGIAILHSPVTENDAERTYVFELTAPEKAPRIESSASISFVEGKDTVWLTYVAADSEQVELQYKFGEADDWHAYKSGEKIPLVESEVVAHGWMDEQDIVNFIAVSESTPGSFAVNVATYVGEEVAGIAGSVCATLGVVLPSFIIILIIAGCYKKFKDSGIIKGCMSGLKPAVVGLIGASVISVGREVFIPDGLAVEIFKAAGTYVSTGILVIALILSFKKVHPIIIIILSAILGIAAGYIA